MLKYNKGGDGVEKYLGLAAKIAGRFASKYPHLREDLYSKAQEIALRHDKCPHENVGAYLNKSISGELRKLTSRHRDIPITGEDICYSNAVANVLLTDLLDSLSDAREKKILTCLAEGYNNEEISDLFGISKQRCSIIVREIRRKLKEVL